MAVRLPRLGCMALCAAAACACASMTGAYFGVIAPGMTAFLCYFLLFVSALSLAPQRREALAALLCGGAFGLMYTLGYSYDTLDSYGLILKSGKTLMIAAGCMLSLALAGGCVCLLLFRLLDAMRKAARGREKSAAQRRRLFWISAAAIFLGSVPYLMLYAPGLNIFDTHDQLLQFFGYPSYIGDGSALSDHHPVFLTVVYAAFMKLGLLLGDANIGQLIYSLLSMAVLALAWAHLLCTLYDAGIGARALYGFAACIALYPVYALYAFNMCKDVSAMPFVLLFAAQVIRLEQTEGTAMKERRFALVMFVNALLLMLTRKPSMYALAFAAVFLIIRFRGVRVRLCAALLGAAMLFHVGFTGMLLPAMGVIPGETREMLSVPFQMTARCLIQEGGDVSPEEREAIARVLDIEHSLSHYDPRLSDPVKDSSNPEMTGADLAAYLSAFVSMGLRHPNVYLDAWLNMIYGYFYPSESNTIVCLTLNSPDQGGMTLTQDPRLDDARLGMYNFIYYTLRRLPGAGMLFYVHTVTWALVFLLAYRIVRRGFGAALPWMFFLGTLGIALLGPKNGEIRYLMPILYALPAMIGSALIPDTAGKEADNDPK